MPTALRRLVSARPHLGGGDVRVLRALQPLAGGTPEALLAQAGTVVEAHPVIPTVLGANLEAAVLMC